MSILAGLYGFSPTDVFVGFHGDQQAGLSHLGHVKNALQTLQYVNKLDLKIYSHTVYFDDGVVVTAYRNFGQYSADVYVPVVKGLKEGEFYWVPGCVARYGFKEGKELYNEIPLKRESDTGDTSNIGRAISFIPIADVGLPEPGCSPDGSVVRSYCVCQLDEADPDSGLSGSQIEMAATHVPMDGPFSLSCVVRLRKEIQIDYSFSSKTVELDCGYTVYNPIKARFLLSGDGETWKATCPGSLAPLIGCKVPSRFSDHYVNLTFPWPNYNDNFVDSKVGKIGYREIATICDGEQLLISAYDPASPYWDKVLTGELETLSGSFDGGWAENTETQNAAPYASYCRFNTTGSHAKAVGTRAVRTLDSGERRYATVYSCSYDEGTDTTSFVLQDYQYKLYMTESDGDASIVFGKQPFPVCNPEGYIIGINILGLCWYNGNRILAGKVVDFQTEYTLPPIVSDPLDIGAWYHVCMTYDKDGITKLYYVKMGDTLIKSNAANQSISTFGNATWFGNSLPLYVGADNWGLSPLNDSPLSDYKSLWEYSSSMDIGMLRFYHRALTKSEAQLLTMEVFDGVFVADDFEASQLQGYGLQAVTV